jgi:hypothetical protein
VSKESIAAAALAALFGASLAGAVTDVEGRTMRLTLIDGTTGGSPVAVPFTGDFHPPPA